MRILMRVLFVVLLAMLALGCGEDKKQPEKKQEAPAKAEAPAAAPAPAATPGKTLKVGFVYVSPIGDAGYSYAHDQGRKAIADMPGVETSYVEAVPEGADAERVLTKMARDGYGLIFATSFGYMDSVIKVAKDYPNVIFEHCSGFKRADNVGTYFGR
ncbi:basic membrane lipoprotein, partial [Desulfovibrio sp. X2]|uniref:BMP family ABC transporter substrate-binding protein n=1 Tax=Desulfovibrio sp. X2 TaxID=941449 RepID=UPI000358B645